MTGTEWQRKRGNRLGFLGATFLSIVCLGALVVIGLTIASTGADEGGRPALKKQVAQIRVPVAPPAPAEPATETDETSGERTVVSLAGSTEESEPVSARPADGETEVEGVKGGEIDTGVATVVPEGPVTWEDGETAFHEKRYADASGIFERYTEIRPDNPWGHYILGLSLWKAGDAEGAESALRQAVAIDSNHVKAQINLGRVLIDLERPEEALPPIRFAIEREPDNVDAWRVLGRTAHSIGIREEAIYAYEQALARDGDDAWSLNNLGLVLMECGQFESALGPLARAVALEDAVAVFQNNLGMALERTGHTAQAAEAYSRAVTFDPSYEKAAVNLARVEPLADEGAETPVDLAAIAEAWTPGVPETEVAQSSTDPVE